MTGNRGPMFGIVYGSCLAAAIWLVVIVLAVWHG